MRGKVDGMMGWRWKDILAMFNPVGDGSPLCSFCGFSYLEIGPFVEGHNSFICGVCLRRAQKGFDTHDAKRKQTQEDAPPSTEPDAKSAENPYVPPAVSTTCSFCGKFEAIELAHSPMNDHTICRTCLGVSIKILDEEIARHRAAGEA